MATPHTLNDIFSLQLVIVPCVPRINKHVEDDVCKKQFGGENTLTFVG